MPRRVYGHYSPLAQALDSVGERWALLVVGELLGGEARYGRLQQRLPGIGSAQLAARLRELERDGLVDREPSTGAYRLTAAGQGLAPAVYALARFGLARLRPLQGRSTAFRPSWAALSLRALADAAPPLPEPAIFETRVEDEVFQTVATAEGARTMPGGQEPPDLTVTTDTVTVFDLVAGIRSIARARAEGLLDATGGERLLEAWAWVHGLRTAP